MAQTRPGAPAAAFVVMPSSPRVALLIAYNYPPSREVGTQRTLRFERYLPEFGWTPCILAPRAADLVTAPPAGRDHDPPRVYRAPVWRPLQAAVRWRNRLRRASTRAVERAAPAAHGPAMAARPSFVNRWIDPWFTTPDDAVGWVCPAVKRGLRAVRESKPCVLYTTGPPHSAHLVGALLKTWTGLPWVADFRDPWARRPWAAPSQRRGTRARVQRYLERLVVGKADRCVFNTDRMADEFRGVYPDLANRFLAIPNGYDPEASAPRRLEPEAKLPHPLTLLHAGTLYRRRTPMPLIEAIRRLRDAGQISHADLRLRLVGTIDPAFGAGGFVATHGLGDLVSVEPPVARDTSLQLMDDADVLLLIQPDTQLQVPGKLFEYLQFRKPVLALASPTGATADIVTHYGLGDVAPDDDPDAIAQILLQYIQRHRAGSLGGQDLSAAFAAFDGRRLTGRLAEVFTDLTRGPAA